MSLRLGGEVDPATGESVNGEEYSAEGFRIRLAQHAVAAEALRLTHYPSPPPRPPRTQRNKRSDCKPFNNLIKCLENVFNRALSFQP